jgi:hypothetical protein
MRKLCNACKETKEESEFYRRKDTVTGLKGTCKTCDLLVKAKYRKSEKGMDVARKSTYRSISKSPLERKARTAVANAIATGKLKKQPCFMCGLEKAEAHHADYNNPLGVTWLCRQHHIEAHNLVRS